MHLTHLVSMTVRSSFDSVTLLSDQSLFFSGWAFDVEHPAWPLSWVAIQDRTILMSDTTTIGRPDVIKTFGYPAKMSSISVRSPELFQGDLDVPVTLLIITKNGKLSAGGNVLISKEKVEPTASPLLGDRHQRLLAD